MAMSDIIKQKVTSTLDIEVLDIVNESHMHAGPAADSHFKLVVVSPSFEGKRLLARHRMLNECLASELAGEIHALALHTFTPIEWQKRKGEVALSPNCMGANK